MRSRPNEDVLNPSVVSVEAGVDVAGDDNAVVDDVKLLLV